MNGMLSAHIARYDSHYMETVEQRLRHYAGSAAYLSALEARVCEEVASLESLVAQYQALLKLAEIARAVTSDLNDYHEMVYQTAQDECGEPTLVAEERETIRAQDVLDERFAYVRAIYGDSILTFAV